MSEMDDMYGDPEGLARRQREAALQQQLGAPKDTSSQAPYPDGVAPDGSGGFGGWPKGGPGPITSTATPAPAQAPSAAGTTRDQALQQVQQAYSSAGGNINDANGENMRDFESRWNQSNNGQNWGNVFGELQGVIANRFPNEVKGGGQPSPSSSGGAGGLDTRALDMLQQFMGTQQAAQARQEQERAQMREILMGQLGGLSKPVSADDPGIREVLQAQHLTSQRGLESGRAQAAEQRAYEGYGAGSDQLRMDAERLGQHASEAETGFTGQVMHQELQQRRQALTQMLQSAMAIGDAESARNINAQLQAIQAQLGQSNFYDSTALGYAGLNQSANQNALLALLNAS